MYNGFIRGSPPVTSCIYIRYRDRSVVPQFVGTDIVEANVRSLKAGYNYGETLEVVKTSYRIPKAEFESLPFETHFNFTKINSLFSNLSSLTIWSLIKLREDYKSLKYSTKELDIHLNKLFSYPLYVALMSIISSILMLNIKYNTNKIFNLTLGILLSVIIYYINHFFGTIGLAKQLPIFFSNWLPLILLIIVSSIGLVRINEK